MENTAPDVRKPAPAQKAPGTEKTPGPEGTVPSGPGESGWRQTGNFAACTDRWISSARTATVDSSVLVSPCVCSVPPWR